MKWCGAVGCGLSLLAWLGQAQAQADAPLARHAEVLAVIELPAVEVDGIKVRELSALAWSPEEALLYAASDKGRLFRYELQWMSGRLTAATARGAMAIVSPQTGRRMNIEALAWQAPAQARPARLLLAGESEASAWSLPLPATASDRPQALAWPVAVAAALASAGGRQGVEAAEWHPAHGLLAALQRPGTPMAAHVIYAADGTQWRFIAAAQRSDIKAIERIGAHRLLVLERLRGGVANQRQFVLRELELRACALSPCNPAALALTSTALDGSDNFEGMTCRDDNNCLLVSDDGSEGTGTTKLVQVLLRRGPP